MMISFKAWRSRGARFMLALAAAALGAGAAPAQNAPTVIAPLQVEPDRNNVNLHNGRTRIELPVLAVPGAPNLRFDRLQNAAPYLTGRVTSTTATEHDQRSYAVHVGAASSDAFDCYDAECTSVSGTGSTIVWSPPVYHQPGTSTVYRQAGSGAVWLFNRLSVATPSPNQSLTFYASRVTYPSGETIDYSYDTAAPGLPFGRILFRPTRLTSNLGYFIEIKYHGTDPNTSEWGSAREAAIYSSAAPTVPLGRLSYSGATITDHGARAYADPAGRVYTCQGCPSGLGVDIEVHAGSTQLPGEGSPALQVAAHPGATVVGSVTRDAVPWTYSYGNLRLQQGTLRYIFDQLIVNGPNGFNQVYDIANSYHGIPDIAANRVHTTITRATDSLNRATSFHYDTYDRPIRIVHPELNEVSVQYDVNGNITSRTATPRPGSPGLSPVTETANFPTAGCVAPATTVLCWRPTWTRDGRGWQTDYAYNAAGQLTEQIDPADASGVRRRTSTTYEISNGVSRRKVVRICADTGTSCATNAPAQTEYQYVGGPTLLPTLERRIDAATGQQLDTAYSYDAAGRLLLTDGPLTGSADTIYNRYDIHGRKTWEIGALAPNGLRIATRTAYRDSDDKPVSTETGTIPNASSTTLTVLSRSDLAYDSRRNPVRETASASGTAYGVLQRTFDLSNRLECEARRMNPAVFASLPASACALGTQGSGANDFGPDRITRNVYDAAGQRLQLREGVGVAGVEAAEATWVYNPSGQITTVIDGNGNRATLGYDGHGRQDRWTFPSTTRPTSYNDATQASALATAGSVNAADYEAYGYDAAGNRTSLRKRDGSTLSYQYDNLNRMTRKTVPERAGLETMHTRDVFYGYDLRNLQLFARFDSTSGEGVTNVYDGFGRLTSSSINMGGTTRALTHQYDPAGNRTQITQPGALYFTYQYDALNRLDTAFQGVNALVDMSYDAQGRPSGRSDGTAGAGGTVALGYDPITGRVTSLAHDLAGTSRDVGWTYGHNPAGQIRSIARSNDAFAWTGHYAINRAYTTDGLNRYTAAGPAGFGYDANGNLTSDGSTTFTYDVENRLVRTAGASNGVIVYDPLGRIFQYAGTVGGTTLTFLYDGDALVAEFNGAGTRLRAYAHGANAGADDPIVWYEGTQRRFLRADHQGSIVQTAGSTGTPLDTNAYDEYGIPGAANAGRFQYTGQAWLPELGLYHYKARVYSPTLGRFMQTDPVGYDDQFNLYAYVANDPINHADPTGKTCETTTGTNICPGTGSSSDHTFRDRMAAGGAAVGAILGGVAGGGTGGTAGATAGLACGPGAVACSPAGAAVGATQGAAVGAGAGAVAGGVVGGLIGAAIDQGIVLFNKARGRGDGGGGDRQTNGRPGPNTVQNRQVRQAARQERLSPNQRRDLGRAVEDRSRRGGENLGYHDIRAIARDIKSGNN